MLTTKKSVGAKGENLAANYLQSKGYTIVHRNFRAKRYGEVDIIAQKTDLLVFVEVKTRIGMEFGRPEEAITFGKIREVKKMVNYFYNLHPKTALSPQIDVIAVTLNPDQTLLKLEHFGNVTM